MKRKKSILERMREIIKMWKLVNFIRKYRFELALKLNEQKAKDRFNEIVEEESYDLIQKIEFETGKRLTSEEKRAIIDSTAKEYEEFTSFSALRGIENYNTEAVINRRDLLTLYLIKKYPDYSETYGNCAIDVKAKNKEMHSEKVELSSILQSCMEGEKPYLKPFSSEGKELYLTIEGKYFAGYDGLLKALIQEIGVVYSMFATAILFGWPWMIKVINYLSPWW